MYTRKNELSMLVISTSTNQQCNDLLYYSKACFFWADPNLAGFIRRTPRSNCREGVLEKGIAFHRVKQPHPNQGDKQGEKEVA